MNKNIHCFKPTLASKCLHICGLSTNIPNSDPFQEVNSASAQQWCWALSDSSESRLDLTKCYCKQLDVWWEKKWLRQDGGESQENELTSVYTSTTIQGDTFRNIIGGAWSFENLGNDIVKDAGVTGINFTLKIMQVVIYLRARQGISVRQQLQNMQEEQKNHISVLERALDYKSGLKILN